MAGIGFELGRMLDSRRSMAHSVKSYGLAVVTLHGPMILCMATISIARLLTGSKAYSGIPAGNILVTIAASFILSAVITGSYSFVLQRYVSDCIYNKEYAKILPSLYGAMIPALLAGSAAAVSMVLWGGLKAEYGALLSLQFSVVCIVWLEMIYLSAVKNYKSIIGGFFAGNLLCIILLLLIETVPEYFRLQYIFFSFSAGLSLTAALLMRQIRNYFGSGTGDIMKWAGYFLKYPLLSLTGLFYTAGFYFLYLYYRLTGSEVIKDGFILLIAGFDMPFSLAVLSMIPGLVFFSVRFETPLYKFSRELNHKLNSGGTYGEISYCLQNIIAIIKYGLIKLLLVQSVVVLLLVSVSLAVVPANSTAYVYWALTAGVGAALPMYAVILIILYFDAKGYAAVISVIYFVLNIGLTVFFDLSRHAHVELGFLTASLISLSVSAILLTVFMKNIRNYILVMKH